jgi:hypothetical protein
LRRVNALRRILLMLLLVGGGFWGYFWHRYPRLVVTHAQLLADMAEKGRDLVAVGQFTAESLPELTYPLKRALAFEQESLRGTGSSPPASLLAFSRLVVAYQGLVQTLDDARRAPRAAQLQGRAGMDAVVAAIRADAEAVRVAAAAEQ